MVEALEQEKAQLKNELDSCDNKKTSLERLMQGLEVSEKWEMLPVKSKASGCCRVTQPFAGTVMVAVEYGGRPLTRTVKYGPEAQYFLLRRRYGRVKGIV